MSTVPPRPSAQEDTLQPLFGTSCIPPARPAGGSIPFPSELWEKQSHYSPWPKACQYIFLNGRSYPQTPGPGRITGTVPRGRPLIHDMDHSRPRAAGRGGDTMANGRKKKKWWWLAGAALLALIGVVGSRPKD